jgi:hypothetical protein
MDRRTPDSPEVVKGDQPVVRRRLGDTPEFRRVIIYYCVSDKRARASIAVMAAG